MTDWFLKCVGGWLAYGGGTEAVWFREAEMPGSASNLSRQSCIRLARLTMGSAVWKLARAFGLPALGFSSVIE